ncbi:hypothetical protein FHT00_003605 [Sphingomonas insulae]|uniref:Uncharacterized protein n=1 Tax=Sphingomonas insulae TaxID=424800 RepID=A0ABN1I069_9SPHN|nr:hypothetical protein [Sphingomonas insulae]NIJ31624.1 hypothetical protein [Sphingomonas insulae]
MVESIWPRRNVKTLDPTWPAAKYIMTDTPDQTDALPKSRIYRASAADIARQWIKGDRHARARIDAMLECQNEQIRRWTDDLNDGVQSNET